MESKITMNNPNRIRLQFGSDSYEGEIQTNNYLYLVFIKMIFNIKYRRMWATSSMFYIGKDRQAVKKFKDVVINRFSNLHQEGIKWPRSSIF